MKKLLIVLLFFVSLNCGAYSLTEVYQLLIKYEVDEPEISLAIVVYETGWLKCKNCCLSHNNIFGFMYKGKVIHYPSITHSIKAYRKWQLKHWNKFHLKYPNKTYYDFLEKIYYCNEMTHYIRKIKTIKRLLKAKKIICT